MVTKKKEIECKDATMTSVFDDVDLYTINSIFDYFREGGGTGKSMFFSQERLPLENLGSQKRSFL